MTLRSEFTGVHYKTLASLTKNIGAVRSGRDLKALLPEQCQTKAGALHRNLVPPSRRLSASQLLHAVRGHDLSGYSDGQLYQEMARLSNAAGKDVHSDALPRAFAVVKESVQRRLGAWRIFDPSFSCGLLEVYRQAADQVIRAAVDTIGAFSRGPERAATVALIIESGSSTVQEGLDPDARILVDTLAKVQDSLRWKGGSDVLLPAEFYQALFRKDVAGETRFEVTDEQLLSGIHLYRGSIVEMYSGEGKTIAAAFPAVMHAVEGRAVHIVTANDYLAFRDSELLAPVYKSLGVSVDAVMNYMIDEERRETYAKQIVYGTMREFGFDYLRDNVKMESMEQVQRALDAVIVDEADQCLIDDAATPMIIAGQSASGAGELLNVKNAVTELIARQRQVVDELHVKLSQAPNDSKPQMQILAQLWVADQGHQEMNSLFSEDSKTYKRVQAIIYPEGSEFPDQDLTIDLFFAVDPHLRFVTLTDKGQAFLQSRLGSFYDARDLELDLERISSNKTLSPPHRRKATSRLTRQLDLRYRTGNQVYQMLRALLLLKKDTDYLVTEDSILLLDRHTGRHRPDSRYQEGLQAALEAKEGLAVRPESEVLGQISVQGFANKYRTLTGMTGTATSATDEFKCYYGLNVVTIPTSRTLMRRDLGYRVYKTKKDKLAAIADEVALCHRVGRPVLVGTSTIEQSEEVSRLLGEKGVPHNLLNAVTCQDEAQIIRDAGAFGAVTVATNMAGRGTDILLHDALTPRILSAYTQLIRDVMVRGATAVALRCLTQEEADILSVDLELQGEFSVSQNRRGQDIELIAMLRGIQDVQRADCEPRVHVDFGLGLHVIGTELNESPRVELQMRGRSGRQGHFGSSTVSLSFEDSLLVSNGASAVCAQGCAKVDQGSREYWDGERVDDHIRRIQQRVDRDVEIARSFAQDYASIIDAQTCLYYSARQDIMNAGSLFSRCLKAAEAIGGRIADRHFPELDVTNYRTQFSRMVEDVAVDYGVDCNDLFGVGLNQLGASIGRVIAGRVKMVRSAAGVEVFDRLARLLLLETCDEAWREHISTLHELRRTSQLFNHGHHSALAECIGHGYHAWDYFQSNVDEAFLAKLLHFSVDEIAGTAPDLALQITLADDAVLVLA